LQAFLAAFPNGVKANDARLYLALSKRIDEIRSKREKSALVIPFGVIDGMGLVHLRGKGKVIMPDGKGIELE
jgi:hypothetical protein